jgi:putative membrane protein
MKKDHLPIVLLLLYIPVWVWAAINPLTRIGWVLENILTFVFIPILIWTYYRFRLSNLSYVLIFIFFILHTVGGHYTYEQVPFGWWLKDVLDLGRNHFDRIVHFCFGFLLAYPIREVFLRIVTKGFWGYYLPLELILAFSGIFEIVEWLIVLIVAPDAGIAYLGTQGDIWDAQKDMALAGLGALLAMIIAAVVDWKYDNRFFYEMRHSFKNKDR